MDTAKLCYKHSHSSSKCYSKCSSPISSFIFCTLNPRYIQRDLFKASHEVSFSEAREWLYRLNSLLWKRNNLDTFQRTSLLVFVLFWLLFSRLEVKNVSSYMIVDIYVKTDMSLR